jgi:hypothetical protein
MGRLQQVASNDWPQQSHTVAHPNTPQNFQPFISMVLRFQFDFQLISPTDTKIKFSRRLFSCLVLQNTRFFSFEMIPVTIDKPKKIKIVREH